MAEATRRVAGSRNEPGSGLARGTELARFMAEVGAGGAGRGSGHPYVFLLGLEPAELDTIRLVERVEQGFRFQELEHLRENAGLSKSEVADLVQIKPRTLDRRKREGRLEPEESDRLLRAAKVFGDAIALFEGDVRSAKVWLSSPQIALGDAIPLKMARTDVGAREVEDLIGRLEHGVFS